MDVIDFLKSYRRKWYEAITAEKELLELEQTLGLTSGGQSGLPRSTARRSDPTGDKAIQLADKTRIYRQKALTARLNAVEIERAIDKSELTDNEYAVIHERYITMPQGTIKVPGWSDIALTLHYSAQHCKFIHTNALRKIAEMNNLEHNTKSYDNEVTDSI